MFDGVFDCWKRPIPVIFLAIGHVCNDVCLSNAFPILIYTKRYLLFFFLHQSCSLFSAQHLSQSLHFTVRCLAQSPWKQNKPKSTLSRLNKMLVALFKHSKTQNKLYLRPLKLDCFLCLCIIIHSNYMCILNCKPSPYSQCLLWLLSKTLPAHIRLQLYLVTLKAISDLKDDFSEKFWGQKSMINVLTRRENIIATNTEFSSSKCSLLHQDSLFYRFIATFQKKSLVRISSSCILILCGVM